MKPNATFEQLPAEVLIPFLIELVEAGKIVNLTVTGYSMMPLLRNEKDSVLLSKPEKLRLYDVVLYYDKDGKPILHRIVKKTPAGYMIVGDNQKTLDGPVAPEQIRAVAVGYYRDGIYFSASAPCCRIYGFLWGRFRRIRGCLYPFVVFGGRILKRMMRLRKKHEMDS